MKDPQEAARPEEAAGGGMVAVVNAKRKQKLIRSVIIGVLLVALIIGIAVPLSNRGNKSTEAQRSALNGEELNSTTTVASAPSGGDSPSTLAPTSTSSSNTVSNDDLPDNGGSNDGGDSVGTTEAPLESPTFSPYEKPSLEPTLHSSTNPSSTASSAPSSTPSSTPSTGPSVTPSAPPTEREILYRPGDLSNYEEGLMLSAGLSARIIAKTGDAVQLNDGSFSSEPYHRNPDGAATFADTRPHNIGGWVYVSNSEVKDVGAGFGGVGAVTFNKDGQVIGYKMILTGTTNNCSGGKTPWNTWVSCEEINKGNIYQVDPFGVRPAEMMTLGSAGGHWESFAYDIRNPDKPYFYVTEDEPEGCLRRYTPDSEYIDWVNDPWKILHSPGVTDFLMVNPDRSGNSGTYSWTDNFRAAEANAELYYPESEGIDIFGNELFFTVKRKKELYVLNLDDGTYWKRSTVSGVFDGMPDQMQRILGNEEDLLYFTEEQGRDNGIHARDSSGRFYTIFESPVYSDETTGLAFSPDGMHMYVSYQNRGYLFDIFRQDGLPFHAKKLDIRYHSLSS